MLRMLRSIIDNCSSLLRIIIWEKILLLNLLRSSGLNGSLIRIDEIGLSWFEIVWQLLNNHWRSRTRLHRLLNNYLLSCAALIVDRLAV